MIHHNKKEAAFYEEIFNNADKINYYNAIYIIWFYNIFYCCALQTNKD